MEVEGQMLVVSLTGCVTLHGFCNFPDFHVSHKSKVRLTTPVFSRGTGCVIKWNNI